MLIEQASKLARELIIKFTVDREYRSNTTWMIQGCTSDAGKSVMVAGLCRLISRRSNHKAGQSVAPFKPQNMALNSAVTVDGGEIGRAQAVQAQACNIEAHTDMNPILLKPSSDIGAQVIVHGHAIQSMQAKEYHNYKKVAMDAVLESHDRLSQQYQTIVVEGAGSPAEINLRANDIANMGFAEAVDCPVVLIADIDRGGVFAHLVGTLELLSQSEQDRVVGFIINRFRGDIALLENGLQWLEQKTNKPVLGVVPYLPDFFLDAEDAISCSQINPDGVTESLNIVVPVLSRISNHTDFDALRMHPNINLQFVSVDQDCPAADLIILPGSKNVINDLNQLKNAGWQNILNKHLRYGGKVIGICGGYQMLGNLVSDPHSIESSADATIKDSVGFGLLNMSTELQPEKQLKRVSGKFSAPQLVSDEAIHHDTLSVCGYEIHCGTSQCDDSQDTFLFTLQNDSKDGLINTDNNVLGTYIHGLFDTQSACNILLNWAGLKEQNAVDLNQIREQQLDRLADCLEGTLDSDFLSSLINAEKYNHKNPDSQKSNTSETVSQTV